MAFAMKSADEFKARVLTQENFAQFRPASLGAAEQVMGKLVRNIGKELSHECGAVHSVPKSGAGPVQAPDQRHPIGGEAVIGVSKLAKGRLVAPHGDDLSIGKVQSDRAGLAGPLKAAIAERHVIGYEQWGAEDVEFGHGA